MEEKQAFINYNHVKRSDSQIVNRSASYFKDLSKRRTIRDFSDKEVSKEVIEHIIMTASSAPSGAHKQPWTFCVISNAELKSKIRAAAEKEEHDNYHHRMSDAWLKDLEHLGTDEYKEFLDTAPWVVVLFRKTFEMEGNEKRNVYYVNESVGIAAGFFIAAVHQAGLVTLTHTPSPMGFLTKILDRPKNERPFLLLPVGYPASDAEVPVIEKKGLDEVAVYY